MPAAAASPIDGADFARNLAPTAILDWKHPLVAGHVAKLGGLSGRELLQAAHQHIHRLVGPVYTVDELQPVSRTLEKGKGSCSQRMACLEAFARARGIPTRVRALYIAGPFWAPRFKGPSRAFIPRKILLAWPQLNLGAEGWIDFDELFASTAQLASNAQRGFTNDGETMFEAVAHTTVDFLGKTRSCGVVCTPGLDLSKYLVGEAGTFDTRDELFSKLGNFATTLKGRAFELIYGGRKSV
jgi:hypothetical protein